MPRSLCTLSESATRPTTPRFSSTSLASTPTKVPNSLASLSTTRADLSSTSSACVHSSSRMVSRADPALTAGCRCLHVAKHDPAGHVIPPRRAQGEPSRAGCSSDSSSRDEPRERASSRRRNPRQRDVLALRPPSHRQLVREGWAPSARAFFLALRTVLRRHADILLLRSRLSSTTRISPTSSASSFTPTCSQPT